MRRILSIGFAAALAVLAALPAQAQTTTTLDQLPVPLTSGGTSELLIQSTVVTGGAVINSILRPSGTNQSPLSLGSVFVPTPGSSTYAKAVPSTGFTLAMSNAQKLLELNPAGTLAAGYVNLAPSPTDGTDQCVFSSKAITNFYPTAINGASINNAVTTLAANTRVCYLYSLSNTTWDRSQ